MAEVVGLAASILTLASATAQLAKTLLEVANIIGSAGFEARLIAADISVFSSSLVQLRKVLELACPETHKLREITVVLIAACTALIKDLTLLIGDPPPIESIWRAFVMPLLRRRFRWLLDGSSVMFVKSMVDSFKTTILLLVSTMDLATELHRNAPKRIKQSLMTQVESNIVFAEDATETLCRHKDIQDVPSEVDSSASLTTDSATPKQIGALMSEPEQALVLLHTDIVPERSNREMTHQSMISHDNTSDVEACSNIDMSASHSDHMEYYVQLSHGCNERIEVQQKSCTLARSVLDKSAPIFRRTTQPELYPRVSAVKRDSTTKDSIQPRVFPKQRFADSLIDDQDPAIDGQKRYQRLDTRLRHRDEQDDQAPELHGIEQNTYSVTSGYAPTVDSSEDGLSASINDDPPNSIPLLPNSLNIRSKLPAERDDTEQFVPRKHPPSILRDLRTPTPPSPPPRPPAPPPHHEKEEYVFTKLEKLLFCEGEKVDLRQPNAKFNRLKQILISQQVAKIGKEMMKAKAKEEADQAVAETKKQGDLDKPETLETLILAQKDQRLRGEKAFEAVRIAEKAETNSREAKRASPIMFEDAIGRKFSWIHGRRIKHGRGWGSYSR